VRTLKRTDVGEELREVALFSEASRSELAQIRGLLMQMPIAAGTVLMHEGAVGSEFMILADGTAEVRQGGRLLATIGAGDVVGEMALLQSAGRGYRNATVTAVTPLTVYVGTPVSSARSSPSLPRWPKRSGAPRPRGACRPPELPALLAPRQIEDGAMAFFNLRRTGFGLRCRSSLPRGWT